VGRGQVKNIFLFPQALAKAVGAKVIPALNGKSSRALAFRVPNPSMFRWWESHRES